MATRKVATKKASSVTREIFQDAAGKFHGPSGQFVGTRAADILARKESGFRHRWGKPPRNWTWVRLAHRYPDRIK